MYQLIVMVCVGLNCSASEVISTHPSMDACEAALAEEFKDFVPGEAGMCLEIPVKKIKT